MVAGKIETSVVFFCLFFVLVTLGVSMTSSAGVDQCCLKMKNGAICQDIPYENCGDCSDDCEPYKCEQSASCKIGCCFNPVDGICAANSPQVECEEKGGNWSSDNSCNIASCSVGCCILENEGQITTQARCNFFAKERGINADYKKNIKNLYECQINAENSSSLGACVIENGGIKSCKIVTDKDCLRLTKSNSSFYSRMLCSNPTIRALDINCQAQFKTGCVDGKDEVYWFDSCGNKENIYDADKTKSWNNGFILDEKKSCELKGDFSNSDKCGNCDSAKGSICADYKTGRDIKKPSTGNKICINLNCEFRGKKYLNGESWCVYDSPTDNGESIVGSRHWKYSCVNGEVKSEGCGDYKNNICVSSEKKDNETGIKKLNAECISNGWRVCLDANGQSEENEDVEKNCPVEGGYCEVTKVDVADQFKFDTCTPLFPGGFQTGDFNSNGQFSTPSSSSEDGSGGKNPAEDYCGLATQTCKMYYVKECSATFSCEWICKVNCGCEDRENFDEQMGNLCKRLGDCSTSENIAEYFSDYRSEQIIESKRFNLEESDLENGVALENNIGGKRPKLNKYIEIAKMWISTQSLMFSFLNAGKIKVVEVEYECTPYEIPEGGANCKKCNEDPLRPCSEYKCKSLGAACEFRAENLKNPLCVASEDNPKKEPTIKFWNGGLSSGYKYVDDKRDVSLKTSDGNCVSEFTQINYGITTEVKTNCKYSLFPDQSYKNMSGFVENAEYKNTHQGMISLPSLSSRHHVINTSYEPNLNGSINVSFFQQWLNGDYKIYLKCKDIFGNLNKNDYVINLCVNKGSDLTPPKVLETIPAKESYMKSNKSSEKVSFFLNEPAECKYDYENRPYNAMRYELSCDNELSDFTPLGWPCNGTIQNVTSLIYVKCKDQPWEVEGKRNVNSNAYEYKLFGSGGELKIKSVSPENGEEIISGSEPFSVELKAETSGGVDGTAECKYLLNEGNEYYFYETGKKLHVQKFSAIMAGNYNVEINCKDVAGNEANASTNFNLKLDSESPEIVRSFITGSQLTILTNEPASCKTSTIGCGFEFENVSSMSSGYSKKQNIESSPGLTYYIRCEDIFGNANFGCYMIKVDSPIKKP